MSASETTNVNGIYELANLSIIYFETVAFVGIVSANPFQSCLKYTTTRSVLPIDEVKDILPVDGITVNPEPKVVPFLTTSAYG